MSRAWCLRRGVALASALAPSLLAQSGPPRGTAIPRPAVVEAPPRRSPTPEPSGRTTAARAEDLAALVQRGAYVDAIGAMDTRLARADVTPREVAAAVEALTAVGRPAEAITRTERWRTEPLVAASRAVALATLGQLDAADTAWRAAERGPDALAARVQRWLLARTRSAAAGWRDSLDQLIEDVVARGGPRTPSDAEALAHAAVVLGERAPARVRDALRWFDAAIAGDSLRLEARAALAALFLDRFNYADARATLELLFARNPQHPAGLAALARLEAVDGARRGDEPIARLLGVNPQSPDGRALAAARLIDGEQYSAAIREAERGLTLDSLAPAPWIAVAAARWLLHDTLGHQAALRAAHQRLPGAATAEVQLAETAARNRLYADAVMFARAGLARDSLDARALAVLGVNLLRVGDVAEGRRTLERAFALDPFDVWAKNTLDLLDQYATARTVATPHFDLIIEAGDADVLGLHAGPLAEEAWALLTARYGFTPSGRVRVEFFRSHDDFSVRAVGLGGLGALGVAFGNVLAMDAPAARPRGEFHWGAVLWHEFTHTITLGMTANRVPRWVSEGLSVLEERRARPAWGGGLTPTLLAAYGAGRLQPVSRLNDGFVHPRDPQEVIHSYALAAYVFEMLEARGGIEGVRALLAGYRAGRDTPTLMQTIYGLAPAQLDSTFDAWFRARFARELAAVRGTVRPAPNGQTTLEVTGPWRDAMAEAGRAREAQQWPRVLEASERAIALFPGFAEAGSGYHLIAEAQLALGDSSAARRAFTAIVARNAEAIEENRSLAALLEAARDSAAAQAAWARVVGIDPFDRAAQARLAALATARRDWPVAITARRALVALAPPDRADALYRLAEVLAAAGDRPAARREVLRALDIAPDFEAAQTLLLTLRAAGTVP